MCTKPFRITDDLYTQNVFTEARELLSEWMVKSMFTSEDLDFTTVDLEQFTPDRREIKKEWDHLVQKAFHQNNFSDNYAIRSRFKDFSFPEYDSRNTCPSNLAFATSRRGQSKTGTSKKELESRLLREATDREIREQALHKAKQDEKLRQAQEKREEELLQQEMVRVRKELELERNLINKFRNSQSEIKNNSHQQNPVPQLDLSSISFSSEKSTDEDVGANVIKLSCRSNQMENEKYLIRHTFIAWHNIIRSIKIKYSTLKVQVEFRLKKTYFNYWKFKVREVHLNKEINKAKLDSIELVKKEYIAKQHYEMFLFKQCFSQWKHSVKMEKSTRDQINREILRQEKEVEFLHNLENIIRNDDGNANSSDVNNDGRNDNGSSFGHRCLSDRKSQNSKNVGVNRKCLKSMSSSCSLDDLKYNIPKFHASESERKMAIKPPTQSIPVKPHLNQTVIQQRNIIAAQKREIEALKSAHHYSELLLEARAHELAKNILEKTYTKNNRRCKSGSTLKEASSNVEDKCVKDDSNDRNLCKTETPADNINQLTTTDSLSKPLHPAIIPAIRKDSFVRRMEERAAERARRHAIQEERRRENEQRKKAELAKQLEEEANRIKDEKRILIAAQKEKRIREQKLKQQTELRLAHQQELNSKAVTHRKLLCLRYYGFKPWIKFLIQQHTLTEVANVHLQKVLMRNAFHSWLLHVQNKREQENKFTQNHYNTCLMKRGMKGFKKACEMCKQLEVHASQWYNQQRLRLSFSMWNQYVVDLCIREWQQEETAYAHYSRRLLFFYFKIWIQFPLSQRIQREREYRREQFRKCLLDLVPDFSPPKQDTSELE
ncbi:unnamed protein product [Heterobilharzia americana]|nr:unnamed protein product [Heterobilharzia americana]